MLKVPYALEVDRLKSALTRRFLIPALPALEAAFIDLRAETDRALAGQAPSRRGKAYPYGYCCEITLDVLRRLDARKSAPRTAGERALSAFLNNGGEARLVWGVLRDRFFQNAIQLGSLYVDVSNDTVDVNKPKVEILPMRDSGLALVRDAEHFARIAEGYWDARIYANTAIPALAPLFPMVMVGGAGTVSLQSKTGYMMRLFASDGFRAAERWLRDGPPPPPIVIRALRDACPDDVLASAPGFGVDAAVRACRQLRDAGAAIDQAWLDKMCARFDQVESNPTAEGSEPARREAA
ncbi:MAG TPA: hypothetical protein VN158_14600 [Caulobacter sp.]|nr:hypothetical protein [Caulobacter sp.]